jgi:hypothetical protein
MCRLIRGFALFNPHADIRVSLFGDEVRWPPTSRQWEKWKPHKPTSPHWYERGHLERLVGAYITHDRASGNDRLFSQFISEFDGLTGSQKRAKVLDELNLHRVPLSQFIKGNRLDTDRLDKLLTAMQQHTRPVKPKRLGVIGEDHFKSRLIGMGCKPASFRYSRRISNDGLPWVLECAFGWLGSAADDERLIFTGANWSAAIQNPFRSFGASGEGLEAVLTDQRAGAYEPVVLALHLAHPRIEYTDRGKSALLVGGDND